MRPRAWCSRLTHYVNHCITTDPQIDDSLRTYDAYLTSPEFSTYLKEIRAYLRAVKAAQTNPWLVAGTATRVSLPGQ